MRARYYISFDNINWSEFWPTNSPLVSYVREGTEIFFRPQIDKFIIGRTKNQVVYDDLYSRFFDYTYFGTDIYYKINVLGVDKFYYIGPITDGKINTQNSIFEATPEPDDEYRNILQQYDKKWVTATVGDIFGLASDWHYPILGTNSFVNDDFTTLTDLAGHLEYTNNTSGEVTAKNSVVAEEAIVIIKNLIYTENAPTIGLYDNLNVLISNEETISADGKYVLTSTAGDSMYLRLTQNDADFSTGEFDYEIYLDSSITVMRGNTLENAINYTLTRADRMNLTIDTVSSYLWNDALPTGHAVNIPNISVYFTANPTNDYVVRGPAIWNHLYITTADEITNIKLASFEYSLKDIMDIIKIKLRAFWYIDEDGKFRIEHESFFRNYISQADLTSATYADDKPETDVRIYSYEKSILFYQVKHGEINASNEDWTVYPNIDYSAIATSIQVNAISANVSTDIKYILDNPDNSQNDVFLLLKMTDSGIMVDIGESVLTAGNYYPNVWLGWSYLFENYFDYFAEANIGTVNNAAFTFTHVKEFLKQKGIKFRMAADLDWKKYFTVIEGAGWLDSADYSPETGMYKINIGLNPYIAVIYIVDSEDKTIHITDDSGNLLIK